jgi:hypothetical protein
MNPMPLRQRLENLPVGQKLLAALLVLMVTVLLVANLTFISAAYYISQESHKPCRPSAGWYPTRAWPPKPWRRHKAPSAC